MENWLVCSKPVGFGGPFHQWMDKVARFLSPYLEALYTAIMPKKVVRELTEEEEEELYKQSRIEKLTRKIYEWNSYYLAKHPYETLDFDRFCRLEDFKHDAELIKAMLPIFNRIMEKLKKRNEEANLRAARRKAWIVFFVNFSSIFIKWGLNIAYVGISALVAYLTITWLPPLAMLSWGGMVWVWELVSTINFYEVLYVIGLWTFRVCLVLGFFTVLGVVLVRRNDQIRNGLSMVFGPLAIFPKIGLAILTYCFDTFESVLQFCATFYEESCPPIKIVSEDEE